MLQATHSLYLKTGEPQEGAQAPQHPPEHTGWPLLHVYTIVPLQHGPEPQANTGV